MARLAIRQVKYTGQNFTYASPPMGDGVIVVQGPNGSGKSTFSDIIYFGLGGSVYQFRKDSTKKHAQIVNDTNNFVELLVELNGNIFKFIRYFSSNEITVLDNENLIDTFPINRVSNDAKEKGTFSDWLLNQLGIDVFSLHLNNAINNVLNFTDLFRLIYYDQSENISAIYKAPDNENFVTNSTKYRRAIFEILMGYSFEAYYQKLDEVKKADHERNQFQAHKDAFLEFISTIQISNDWNVLKLGKEVSDIKDRIERLEKSRNAIRHATKYDEDPALRDATEKARSLQISIINLRDLIDSKTSEIYDMRSLTNSYSEEISQIKKIIHTQQNLNIFSSNTCPYCLSVVERKKDKCICGNEEKNEGIEFYFYSQEEYIKILRSKQNNLVTIKETLLSTIEELSLLKEKYESKTNKLNALQRRIIELQSDSVRTGSAKRLSLLEEKMLELKETLYEYNNQLQLELKRQKIEDDLTNATATYYGLFSELKKLEHSLETKVKATVENFSKIYNDFMIKTLPNCRVAYIEPDSYMPVINNEEYIQASATVPIRLMYYLTLLVYSLTHVNTNFPKFLLIDTPDTLGIDAQNYEKCIDEIIKVESIFLDSQFQIILTTGVDKFPKQHQDKVLISLTLEDRLLKPVVLKS